MEALSLGIVLFCILAGWAWYRGWLKQGALTVILGVGLGLVVLREVVSDLIGRKVPEPEPEDSPPFAPKEVSAPEIEDRAELTLDVERPKEVEPASDLEEFRLRAKKDGLME